VIDESAQPVAAEEPAGTEISPEDTAIQAYGRELRLLFEAQKWDELGKHFRIPFVWLMDRPLSVAEALALAAQRLDGSRDLEISILRIVKSETSPTLPHGSYTCCLSWMSADTFEQQEVQFDLHIGFERPDGNWRIAFLGATRTIPEQAPFPQDDAPATAPAEPKAEGNGPVPSAGYALVYVPAWVPRDALHLLAGARPGDHK
jgi:hypothetical protein